MTIIINNPESESPEVTIAHTLEKMKNSGAQDKTNVVVMVFNDQDQVKTDTGVTYLQMGQRLWRSLLAEVNYVLEQYEITGNKLTGITVWHSSPDEHDQSACWSLTVRSSRVEALRDRLFSLVTRQPYGLVNGPAVLVAKNV